MSDQKKPFYKNYLVIILIGIMFSWFLIYYVWVSYPSRIINDDAVNSKNLPANVWKGVPYPALKEKEIEESSYYSALGNTYGTYGDMYGSLNTLFSGLAFATLIISLLLQMLELRETRKELANQSKALLDQKKEFASQTTILKNQYNLTSFQHLEAVKQNFYHQFYALMEERRFRLKNLSVREKITHLSGSDEYVFYGNNSSFGLNALQVYLNQVESQLEKKLDAVQKNQEGNALFYKHLNIAFDSMRFSQISPFINLTDNLITTIYDLNKNLPSGYSLDTENYINLVASSLYPNEAAIIFWYGILNQEWKHVIEKSSLLRYFNYEKFEYIAPIFYDKSAFGHNKVWRNIYQNYYSMKK
ncbi:hypothetical protein OHW43_11795 [Acinetobacter baumannii]|nr:hypothetical protein [Acinetobacter baumannii]